MKEVLCLECDDFILTVWCNGVEKRLDAYQKMLQGRNQFLQQYVIYCLGDFKNLHINFPIVENLPLNNEPLKLSFPIFFDNLQYQFEWEFKDGVEDAKVIHYHQLVNEAFRFKTRRLVGNINTNNDIGWFTLPICYIQNGIEKSFQFKFEI